MTHYREERPWGGFEVLHDGTAFKVKILTVLPGKRLSLQSHEKREENWVVTQGTAFVQIDDEYLELASGQHVFIPTTVKHRLENRGEQTLVLVETQTGSYFGEDDIIRYEDDFQRS
jgi:mannose-6-phosphate isomerase-like protein (cupin superfamily)